MHFFEVIAVNIRIHLAEEKKSSHNTDDDVGKDNNCCFYFVVFLRFFITFQCICDNRFGQCFSLASYANKESRTVAFLNPLFVLIHRQHISCENGQSLSLVNPGQACISIIAPPRRCACRLLPSRVHGALPPALHLDNAPVVLGLVPGLSSLAPQERWLLPQHGRFSFPAGLRFWPWSYTLCRRKDVRLWLSCRPERIPAGIPGRIACILLFPFS